MNPMFLDASAAEHMIGAIKVATNVNNPIKKESVKFVAFNLNEKGRKQLSKSIEGMENDSSEIASKINLEAVYFERPDYVVKNQAELEQAIEKWASDRSEENFTAMYEFMDRNAKYSVENWRLKTIGSTKDLLIYEESTAPNQAKGRSYVLALTADNIPFAWIDTFLREAGEGNKISWYGKNKFSSDYGVAYIKDKVLFIENGQDKLVEAIREISKGDLPEDDVVLTVNDLYNMCFFVEDYRELIETRTLFSKTKPVTNKTLEQIAEIGRIDLRLGSDYARLIVLLDSILNSLGYQEELDEFIKAAKQFSERVSEKVISIYRAELSESLELLKEKDPRFKDFVLTDKERERWVHRHVRNLTSTEVLIKIMEDRDLADSKAGKALDQVLSKHGKSVKAYQDNQEAKAKCTDQEELDNIIECERTMAQAYIDEAKDVALNTSVKMVSPEDVINFLIKVYQEKGLAQRVHGDLVASDTTDTDLKDLYFEILDLCLSKRLQYQFTQAEIGSFYNWLEKVNGEKLAGSKTAKARKLIDDLVKREEAELRGYIEEAEADALKKDVSMDYAGALKLLEKLFGEYAKETLNDLLEREKEDEEWKLSYAEVALNSLKAVNLHKVDRLDLGAFYLWLNTARHELKQG